MTQENTEVVQEQVDTKQDETVEYSPVEVKAIEQGWIPKEDFDGDEAEFIDAAEFVRRGELFRKIETQSRELKAVRNALEAFKVHHSKVKEAEYNRALKTLQEARKQAFVDGEHERAFALEEKIEEVKAEKDQVVQQVVEPPDNSYSDKFQAWVEKNDWYESNEVMRATADALGQRLSAKGLDPDEVLQKVAVEIRKEFAHKFKNPAASRSMAVEPSTRTPGRSDAFTMSAEEKEIMRKIVAVTPGYTEKDYIADLKRTR